MPSLGDLSDPIIQPGPPAWQADTLPAELSGNIPALLGEGIFLFPEIR